MFYRDRLYRYYEGTESGRKLIHMLGVNSERDLLFLMPNNKKRMLGLPLTRVSGRNKRKTKEKRKKQILVNPKTFAAIEGAISEMLTEQFENMFDDMAHINEVKL